MMMDAICNHFRMGAAPEIELRWFRDRNSHPWR
jgi:hypothetical protein